MCTRIAAINLFHVDLDKSWNYLRYCHARAPVSPLPPFQWAEGSAPVMQSPSGVPGSDVGLKVFMAQGCRNSGTAGSSKRVEGNGNLQKRCYQLCLLLSNNDVDPKMIKETIENLLQFDLDNDKSWKYLWYCHIRAPVHPLPPLSKGRGQVTSSCTPVRRPCWGLAWAKLILVDNKPRAFKCIYLQFCFHLL